MAEVSEDDIEKVIANIFDNINDGSNKVCIETLMNLLSSYIQPNTPQHVSLQHLILKMSSDGLITKSEMKKAFVEWTETLRGEIDLNSSGDAKSINNNVNEDDSKFNINCHTPEIQEHHIEMLQNDLAHKEHLITNLKSEIQHLYQQIQSHDEAYNNVMLQKNNLEKKLNRSQNEITSLLGIKSELDNLTDCCQMLKDGKIHLTHKIECLKTENISIKNKLISLNNEKQSLLHNLSKYEKCKKIHTDKLLKAETQIEELKMQQNELSNELVRQEATIKNLVTKNLELNSKLRMRDITNESLDDTQFLNKHTFVTSTPQNCKTLLEELSNVNLSISEGTTSESMDDNTSLFVLNNVDNVDNTRTKKTRLSISDLESKLETQNEINRNLMLDFKDEIEQNLMLEHEIKNLKQLIENLKNCLYVLCSQYYSTVNAIDTLRIHNKQLLYVIKQHCFFIEKKHSDILLKILHEKRTDMIFYEKKEDINESPIDVTKNTFRRCIGIVCILLIIFFVMFVFVYNIIIIDYNDFVVSPWDRSLVDDIFSWFFEVKRIRRVPT